MANKRKIIVHIATSADGYIARPNGDLEWLTKRPAPKGFYGMGKFMNSIDTKLLGRKTYDLSVQMGAPFGTKTPHYVFSRRPAPASLSAVLHSSPRPSARSPSAFGRARARTSG